jgi:hypothetical protein
VTDPLSTIEQHFHIELKRKSPTEYAGPCPFCKDGVDRFVVFLDGSPRYWCRQCETQGFVDGLNGSKPLTTEQRVEMRLRQLERKQREHEDRLSALERMAQCTDHERYHANMSDAGLNYWSAEGMTVDWMVKYKLGSCSRCPLWPSLPSYTIPVINGGRLENIRHRLETNGHKDVPRYLPHIKGLGVQLFNADLIESKEAKEQGLALVEGSKKSIHISERVLPSIGIMGARSFKKEWVTRIKQAVSALYICLDPDAMESARRLASFFGSIARVASFSCKPDDFFVLHGGTKSDFEYYLSQARPIGVK